MCVVICYETMCLSVWSENEIFGHMDGSLKMRYGIQTYSKASGTHKMKLAHTKWEKTHTKRTYVFDVTQKKRQEIY